MSIKNDFNSSNLNEKSIKICCDKFITKKMIKTVLMCLDTILCESH